MSQTKICRGWNMTLSQVMLVTFCRMAVKLQSQQANNPPQTANCPPSTGALAWTALSDPRSLAPEGASRAPLMECHIPPPMAPIQKAPPTSSMIRHGQGSRSAIPDLPMMSNYSGRKKYWKI